MISIDFTLLIQIANFLICLLILKKLIIEPVLGVVAKRDAMNDGLREEIQGMRENAGNRLQSYESRIAGARADMARQRDSMKHTGEEAAHTLVGKANDEARSIRQDAARHMADESAAARRELEDKVQGYADMALGKLLGS